ncbi:MAG: hypothetical protein WCG26_11920, partial [Chloroflexales bacterium]
FERPYWAEPYVGPIIRVLPGQPTAGPTGQPIPSQATFQLEVTVPSGSDAATIRKAFRDAFTTRAQVEYGATARVNQNVPPSLMGDPVLVRDSGTEATYTVQMQGFLYRGQ